jgi:hypothetical protein
VLSPRWPGANSPWSDSYQALLGYRVGPVVLHLGLPRYVNGLTRAPASSLPGHSHECCDCRVLWGNLTRAIRTAVTYWNISKMCWED